MREACAYHPRPHSHQLAALDREISLAAAGDLASYRAASGNLFELTRAAWLDRAANHARVAVEVGDRSRAEAAALDHASALSATGHRDWTVCLAAGSARAAAALARGAEARSAFASMLLSLLGLHGTAGEVERADWRDQAAGAYRALREADAEFAWARLPHQPRYLLRTPWTGTGRELIGRWIDELDPGAAAREEGAPDDPLAEIEAAEARWRSELAHRAPASAPENAATPDDVIAPYRELAASLSGDDPVTVATRRAASALVVAGAGAPTGPDALARIVADGLLADLAAAPLRSRAAAGLARQSLWPDPLVEHHWRTLVDELDQARTPTEVDLVSVHAGACFSVEADWNVALLGSLLAPLRAACVFGSDGREEARTGVDRAAGATHALLGLGPRRLAGLPRVADLLARIGGLLAAGDDGPPGAYEGEGGFELLAEARTWIAVARDLGREELRDQAGMRARLLALFDRAGTPEPASLPRPVALWGALIEPDDLVPALARPRRPPVPGMDRVAHSRSAL